MEHAASPELQDGPKALGHGLTAAAHMNLSPGALYEHAIRRGEAEIAAGGSLVARTGAHTGRSPNDKFIVRDTATDSTVWWGDVNRPMEGARFEAIKARMLDYLKGRELFVLDCFGGADPTHRLPVRVISEYAWHSLFARNLFIQPKPGELAGHRQEFTIIQAPGFQADPKADRVNSPTVILVDFTQRLVLIGGTSYAGECKKSVFTILNYLLPAKNVLPMHCSVNVGPEGDAAIFFGLSGTGKTTLSADPHRTLIGDDEHGWSTNGLFNFEGGCYAKVIRLSKEAEPEIHATTRMFGTVLENVVMNPLTRELDLDDASLTENTRGAYPLSFIPNASLDGIAGHPKNVIMLTADAFGVLPPIAKLSSAQAMYHFLSGYTAKVAGTEKGLGKEPQATFSTCFGAPFMPRHPSVYARMLRERIEQTGAFCWLVNTGWTGGAFGTGERMRIAYTRALLRAALDGELEKVPLSRDNLFGLAVPQACPGVPNEVLNPRGTWHDKGAYDTQARDLVGRFHKNFVQFESHVGDEVKAAAPKAA
ncbi:MAG: phosphoenolpyruvate carboxykinase [Alphaproteobacteria bacterium]|nr:phosphoenolpyruvate carboxykinase [Alphaproteobacteria bacterium]